MVEEPTTGHNRWHPDIAPLIRCEPGDEVILETRDAFDGQFGPGVSLDAVAGVNLDRLHPLTGPVYIEGAEPGDLLDIEIVDIEPASYGYTAQVPGFGFLRDEFPDPFKVDWDSRRRVGHLRRPAWRPHSGWALHGHDRPVPRPRAARHHHRREQALARPRRLRAPAHRPRPQSRATRTSPRTRCARFLRASRAATSTSNRLSKGAHLLIPVDTPGGLFSAGDAHYAQGDCETCGTAIEMDATLHVRFQVRKGEAAQKGIRHPRFTREDYYLPPEFAAPRRFYATTGISVTRDGIDHSEDVSVAARNALLHMIDHLTERGWTPQQAYAICSVAVDLKISQLVDVPNMLVIAFLPEDIFTNS